MSRNPCKSPDCRPERDRPEAPWKAAFRRVSLARVFLRRKGPALPVALLNLVPSFFLAVGFFFPFFFDARFVAVIFLLEVRSDFFAFLPFF